MPEASSIDVSLYLAHISDDQPSGENLRYEEEYDEIRKAREQEDDATGDDPWKKRKTKKADWDAVISLGLALLKSRTKDLELASWVAEALTRRRGLEGLRDGLRLIWAIQDQFWDTVHPLDDEGRVDLELREGVYDFLDNVKRLPLLIKNTPLVKVDGEKAYSYQSFKDSRDFENKLLSPPIMEKNPNLEEELLASGQIRAGTFDSLVERTERSFYVSTIALLDECLDTTQKLNDSLRAVEHFGPKKAPVLSKTLTVLEEVVVVAKDFLDQKPAPDPVPIEPPVVVGPPANDPSFDSPGNSPSQTTIPNPPPVAVSRPTARPDSGPISSVDDAVARIVSAANYLRETDPADPIAYLVVRALSMGGLYRSSAATDPPHYNAPATEDRQGLRRLSNEGSWAELLEHTENILGRQEGTGWLEPRRLGIKALAELGYDEASRASKALLEAELRDHPEWPRSELDDGTPCAGAETLAWIEDELQARPDSREMPERFATPATFNAPTSENEPGSSIPDPWDQAREFQEQGRPNDAIAVLDRAAREARTGRDRFLRTLQQAELCLMMGRQNVAATLLESLARQIDEFHLDRWEDPGLSARVVASLYRCLRGKDDLRARSIYERLCQLDIGLALTIGDGEPS